MKQFFDKPQTIWASLVSVYKYNDKYFESPDKARDYRASEALKELYLAPQKKQKDRYVVSWPSGVEDFWNQPEAIYKILKEYYD